MNEYYRLFQALPQHLKTAVKEQLSKEDRAELLRKIDQALDDRDEKRFMMLSSLL